MAIDPTRPSDVRAASPEAAAAELAASDKAARSQAPNRGDRVEISDEARALAEQGGAVRVPLTEARLAEIRDRLDSGFYASPGVIRDIAQRVLDSGDL